MSTPLSRFLIATPTSLEEVAVDASGGRVELRRSTPVGCRLTALAVSPDGRRVYGAAEGAADAAGHTGRLFAWSRAQVGGDAGAEAGAGPRGDAGATIEPLGAAEGLPTGGVTPCFVALHPREHLLAVTNFRGPGDRDRSPGGVTLFDLGADGAPGAARARVAFEGSGPNLPRQSASHPHCAVFTTSPDVLRVADLGADAVWSVPLDDARPELCGAPQRLALAPGSGPRHLAVVQSGHALLLVCEMANTLVWLAPLDALELQQVTEASLLPHFSASGAAADVLATWEGDGVYASLRGLDEVVGFGVDLQAQKLGPATRVSAGGVGPRALALSSDGMVLAVANTGGPAPMLDLFRRDPATGELTRLDARVPGARLVAALPA
jgi:6-phosphogluconolactonase